MDRILESRLYLMWLSCKNFQLLNQDKNKILLEQIWKATKGGLKRYFKNYPLSLQKIVGTFARIHITLDPTLVAAYDPMADVFTYNLWELLFNPVEHAFCIPTHPLKICETLIHEFDHYSCLKEHSMIGKTDREYEEFDKANRFQVEKRAFLHQIDFLEHCRRNVPFHETLKGISITGWTDKGKPLGLQTRQLAMEKNTSLELIDSMIIDCKKVVNHVNSSETYEKMATKGSLESYSRTISILSLPIMLPEKEQCYPSIEIGM